MVCLGAREGQRQRVPEAMAMGYERTRPLHNFTMPCLKWGIQKHLRCQKFDESNNQTASAASGYRKSSPPSNSAADYPRESDGRRLNIPRPIGGDGKEDENGVAVENGMIDLVNALTNFEQNSVKEGQEHQRSSCRAPINPVASGNGLRIERKQNYESPFRSESAKSSRLGGTGEKAKERTKLTIQLTRKEIEHDFKALVGHRPARRPKKRPRIVQKDLDSLFPGIWLKEVTADMYKVEEFPESGKK